MELYDSSYQNYVKDSAKKLVPKPEYKSRLDNQIEREIEEAEKILSKTPINEYADEDRINDELSIRPIYKDYFTPEYQAYFRDNNYTIDSAITANIDDKTLGESVIFIQDPNPSNDPHSRVKTVGELVNKQDLADEIALNIQLLEPSDNETVYVYPYVEGYKGRFRIHETNNGFKANISKTKLKRLVNDLVKYRLNIDVYQGEAGLGSNPTAFALKLAKIPDRIKKTGIGWLKGTESIPSNENCFIQIVREKTAHKSRYQKKLDAFERQYFQSGCNKEICDEILSKVELNLTGVNLLGDIVYEFKTTKTNTKATILIHDNHAILSKDKIGIESYNKLEHVIKSKDDPIFNDLNDRYEFLNADRLDVTDLAIIKDNILYKTYQPKQLEKALSLSHELKLMFKNYKNLPSFHMKYAIKPLCISTNNERKQLKRIDKVNSYRSSINHPLHRGYPTVINQYNPSKDHQLNYDLIEKYEGLAYVQVAKNQNSYPNNYILPEGNYIYPFNLLRYAMKNNVKFRVKMFYISFKSEKDIYPDIFLQPTKESNNYFCTLNGSLNPSNKIQTKTTNDKDDFLSIMASIKEQNHVIQDVEYGDLFPTIMINDPFNSKMQDNLEEELEQPKQKSTFAQDSPNYKKYWVKYIQDVKSYSRTDVYSYNLAYTRIDIIEKLRLIKEEDLISVKTDSITFNDDISRPLVSQNELVKDKYTKPLNEILNKWQYEEIKMIGIYPNLPEYSYSNLDFTGDERVKLDETDKNIDDIDKEFLFNFDKPIYVTGMAGSGKTYSTVRKVPETVAVHTSTIKENGTKTAQGLFLYTPKDGVWDFNSKTNNGHNRLCPIKKSIILIDEAFRLDNHFMQTIQKDYPYHSFIFIGDPYQICPGGAPKVPKIRYMIKIEANQRYKNDPDYYKLIKKVKRLVGTESICEELYEMNKRMQKDINKLRNESKLFNSLFKPISVRDEEVIYLTATRKRRDELKEEGLNAETICKIQGRTITSKVIVDTYKIKDFRTLYVALSRVTTSKNITLC